MRRFLVRRFRRAGSSNPGRDTVLSVPSRRLSDRSIGVYEYDKRGETLRVAVYVMLVTDARKRWSEMAFRERGWFALDEAVRLLKRHPVTALWRHVVREIGG